MDHSRRRLRAESLLERRHLDGLLILSMEDIRYLTGFTGSDGVVLLGRGDSHLLVDFRYIIQAGEETCGIHINTYKKKAQGIVETARELGWKRVGFNPSSITLELYEELKKGLSEVVFVALKEELEDLRAVKDEEELEEMRRAVSIAEGVVVRLLKDDWSGKREKDLAWAIEREIREAGAERTSFDIIVASGPRGALPHGKAGDRIMRRGELVIIDFGCVVNGYHSDQTITVVFGSPTQDQRRVHAVVKEARDRAIQAVRPGLTVTELDSVARGVIADAGYGDNFGHGLGHGIGLCVHEPPSISPNGEGVLEEEMVFTIEPGIYIPGWGGIRLEDMVLVRAEGAELLTSLSKGLWTIG